MSKTIDVMKMAADLILTGDTVDRVSAIKLLQDTAKQEEAQTMEPVGKFTVDAVWGYEGVEFYQTLPVGTHELFIHPAPAVVAKAGVPLSSMPELQKAVADGLNAGTLQIDGATSSPERDELITELRSLAPSFFTPDAFAVNKAADMLAADARTGHHQEPSIHAGCSPIDDNSVAANSAQLDCTGIQSGEREVLIAALRIHAQEGIQTNPARIAQREAADMLDADGDLFELTEMLSSTCDDHLTAIMWLKEKLAADTQEIERKYISHVNTIADLVNNLLLMDQALPIYGAQYIDHPTRGRCAIAVSPTVSRERVQDSRWIGQGDELNAAIVWTRATQQVVVPQGFVIVPAEVKRLYEFMDTAFTPMTSQQEQIKTSLDLARKAMLAAAPQPPQADAPRVPMSDEERRSSWRTSNNCIPSEWPTYLRGLADAESHHGIGVTK